MFDIHLFLVGKSILVGCDYILMVYCSINIHYSMSLAWLLCPNLSLTHAFVYLYYQFQSWCFLFIWHCLFLVFPMFFSWILSQLFSLHYSLYSLLPLLLLRILHVMLLIFSYGCFVVVRVVVQMFPIFNLHSSIWFLISWLSFWLDPILLFLVLLSSNLLCLL